MWTEEQEKFILENYKTKGLKFCYKALNKSKTSVGIKARRMDLVKQRVPIFNEQEIQFLKENYPSLGSRKCAEILNKQLSQIECKIEKLKIKREFTYLYETGFKRCCYCKHIKPLN